MCYKATIENGGTLKSVLTATKLKKCVIKQFIDVLLNLILVLINIKLKKYVTELFLKNLL